jgi:hypothetical protein
VSDNFPAILQHKGAKIMVFSNKNFVTIEKNRDSSVSIVTRLWAEGPGFDSGQAFAFVIASRPHTSSYPVGTRRCFRGGKQPVQEAN